MFIPWYSFSRSLGSWKNHSETVRLLLLARRAFSSAMALPGLPSVLVNTTKGTSRSAFVPSSPSVYSIWMNRNWYCGSLTRGRGAHTHILVVVDYATCYHEAVALHSSTAPVLARELANLFSLVGFPKQILTDQGTNVMRWVMQQLWQTVGLGVPPLCTSSVCLSPSDQWAGRML